MDLKNRAASLPKDLRRQIIMDYKELELHKFLKELFQSMEPNYTVEITHGPREFGKDLVIVKTDKFTTDVIGVVVKRGDIRAKTLGVVDSLKEQVDEVLSKASVRSLREIKSQIQQAFAHPAETGSILENLPVSNVFVVLAGEFSNQARTRLTAELSKEIGIFDINWLIDNFTEHYPHIFFEGEVIGFLEEQIRELEENHRRAKSGKNLSEYFVEPLIRPINAPLEFNADTLKTVLKKRRKFPFLRLPEISKDARKLILLGDPGSGKTGAMAKLAIDMYKHASGYLLNNPGKSDQKIPVPVLVPAKKFLETESAEEFLIDYFGSEEAKSRFQVDLIMVDGLDEIESGNRRDVIDKLDRFSEEIGSAYILTSRKIDILNTLSEKYEKYELLPLEFSQAVKLVSKLISDKKVLAALEESLERIQTQILLVPLSLMLLVELVEEHNEVPASITELYDRFFDMSLGREDRERGIQVLFDYLIKKKFLGVLAYREFKKKNRLEVPREDFQEFLDSYAVQYGWSPEKLNSFVREIERAGILNLREEVIFKHRSFLDYFAAFDIYENREDFKDLNDLIVSTYFDDIWSEIAFFYIGLRRKISPDLLKMIYAHPSEELAANLCKLFGGRLLQAGWHSSDQQHVDGIKNAIGYATKVRANFREIMASSDSNVPDIVNDFIVMSLSNLSFNSSFLAPRIKDIFQQMVASGSADDIYGAVALFWSIYRFLTPEEVKENIDVLLGALSDLPDAKEQARILLLMTLIEQDKETGKLIKRQVRRLGKKSPEVLKALLPAKRKGFR